MTNDPKPSKSRQIEEIIFVRMPLVAGGLLFLIAAALNIVNVIARYVFSNPIFWAEEISSSSSSGASFGRWLDHLSWRPPQHGFDLFKNGVRDGSASSTSPLRLP